MSRPSWFRGQLDSLAPCSTAPLQPTHHARRDLQSFRRILHFCQFFDASCPFLCHAGIECWLKVWLYFYPNELECWHHALPWTSSTLGQPCVSGEVVRNTTSWSSSSLLLNTPSSGIQSRTSAVGRRVAQSPKHHQYVARANCTIWWR